MSESEQIMSLLHEINMKQEEINMKLDRVINEPQFMKIPAASRHFHLGKNKLRELCEKGIITATMTNDGTTRKHWIINVVSAREELKKGGYLKKMLDERRPRRRQTIKP
jgi:hypothetical protein